MMISTMQIASPMGMLTLAASEDALVGLWIEGQKYWGLTLPQTVASDADSPVLRDGRQWLMDYFDGKQPCISDLTLAPAGGEFRQTVWSVLREIPYGQTATYRDVAAETARRLVKASMSAQATGNAVGHNPLSIIIPCHRVVGANGSLTGYAGGIDKKVQLLRHEGVDMAGLHLPKDGALR